MNPNTENRLFNKNPYHHVAIALKAVRSQVLTATGIGELVKTLIENLTLEAGETLTVLHKDYGGDAKLIPSNSLSGVNEENAIIKKLLNKHDLPSELKKCESNGTLYLESALLCQQAGFSAYKTVLLIPMHLNEEKDIGLFIFTSEREKAFQEHLNSYEYFSEPIGYYFHHNMRVRRNKHLLNLIKSVSKEEPEETELFLSIGQYLSKWYRSDKIYLLVKDPLDTNKLLLAYQSGQSKASNYRDFVLSEEELKKIIGDRTILDKIEESAITLPTSNDIKSFLGAPMRRVGGHVYGYFIVHNHKETHAFEDGEEHMLDAITDYAAQRLGTLREKLKNDELDKVTALTLSKRSLYTTKQLSH